MYFVFYFIYSYIVTTMDEAWRLLDLEFGDVQELRAKFKDQVGGMNGV